MSFSWLSLQYTSLSFLHTFRFCVCSPLFSVILYLFQPLDQPESCIFIRYIHVPSRQPSHPPHPAAVVAASFAAATAACDTALCQKLCTKLCANYAQKCQFVSAHFCFFLGLLPFFPVPLQIFLVPLQFFPIPLQFFLVPFHLFG